MKSLSLLLVVALAFSHVCSISEGKPTDNKNIRRRPKLQVKKKALIYMREYYGDFIDPSKTSQDIPTEMLEEAMMELQETAGLEVTGEIDEPTARMMTWPRCGYREPLEVFVTPEGERKKRYVLSGPRYKWNVMDLTYKLTNYPNRSISIITHEEVDEAVATAFKLWSDVTPLTFTRLPESMHADIVLTFGARVHTNVRYDPPFDGPGGTLAHAFTPNSGWGDVNGDIHYDDDETFTHKKYYGRNLLYVTAHELGHSLGLDHSNTKGALMWPFILSYTPNYQLPQDDILGIQAIYGPNPNTPATTPTTQPLPTTPMPAPAYCNMNFDDVAILRGEIFAFKGQKFWRFSIDGHLINSEEGTLIESFFPNTRRVVNAAYERWYDENVFLLKGKHIFELSGPQLDIVTPGLLANMRLPKSINCAMHRASDEMTYFFKDNLVYKYDESDERLTEDSPQKVHKVFSGIPRGTTVSAAFTGIDGYHYLLVGTEYYKVDPNLQSTGILSNFGQDFLMCPQA